MFGYGEGEVTGRPARDFWLRGARDFRAFRSRLTRDGRVQNTKPKWERPTERHCRPTSRLRFYGRGRRVTGVLAVVKDVTSCGDCTSRWCVRSGWLRRVCSPPEVAHEVGNPLTCISALAQVLIARTSDKAILAAWKTSKST